MDGPLYKRVLLKVSGEVLAGPDRFGFHAETISRIAADIAAAAKTGVQIAIVVGGGNLLRGANAVSGSIDRPTADAMGMLGTVMNGLVLERALTKAGLPSRVMSAIAMPQICEAYSRLVALDHLNKGRAVVLSGGTGNPFFSTDTTSALRAAELACDAVLKGTNVDGIYSADPKKDPAAIRFDKLTHEDAIKRDLKVMDTAAFALARENALPIIVFSLDNAHAVSDVIAGRGLFTRVGA